MNSSSVRVRFAPSPTGYLHIGGARTALFNWLYARHHGGTFILRIDDTDEQRSTEASTTAIFDSMRWLGLDWDEGPDVGGPHEPYFQSERVARHQECARRLLDEGSAYYCYCTKDELEAKRKEAEQAKRPYRYDGRCRDLTADERAAFEREGRTRVVRLKVESQTIRVPDLVLGDVVFEADTLDDF
ncbi:glutamate--tRNA ligase, partial [Candidatus Poribacteria bacterium]|nr:glutamate--tRNA ligase [Candidatus Poribacteria bacterium]